MGLVLPRLQDFTVTLEAAKPGPSSPWASSEAGTPLMCGSKPRDGLEQEPPLDCLYGHSLGWFQRLPLPLGSLPGEAADLENPSLLTPLRPGLSHLSSPGATWLSPDAVRPALSPVLVEFVFSTNIRPRLFSLPGERSPPGAQPGSPAARQQPLYLRRHRRFPLTGWPQATFHPRPHTRGLL